MLSESIIKLHMYRIVREVNHWIYGMIMEEGLSLAKPLLKNNDLSKGYIDICLALFIKGMTGIRTWDCGESHWLKTIQIMGVAIYFS